MIHRLLGPLLAVSLVACVTTPPPSAPDSLEVIALEHASAGVTAGTLTQILMRPGEPTVVITADVRTNSLLVRGPAEEVERIKDVIVALDREVQ